MDWKQGGRLVSLLCKHSLNPSRPPKRSSLTLSAKLTTHMWTINDFRPIYQEFLDSGKTVTQFCAETGIREGRFYHWQKVLRQEAAENQSGEFMPVSINNRGGKVVLVGGTTAR